MIHNITTCLTTSRRIALFLAICLLASPVHADNSDLILKKLAQMEAEIAALKAELKEQKEENAKRVAIPVSEQVHPPTQAGAAAPENLDEALFKPQAAVATTPTPVVTDTQQLPQDLGQFGITYRSDGYKFDTLRFGAYGESIFGGVNSGQGWDNGFDANRMVLLGTYQIAEDIIFNTEIEFEHGGIAYDADDKLNGAVEVEQLFVDFRANDYFTWRSPGVDVVPVGYVNLFHEPTQFYSANRPELYDGLIPSTWFAPSTGAYGKIVDGLNYQFQVSAGLEDAGTTADDDGKVPAGGYEAGISGTEALGLARAPIGDRSQLNDNIAYTARLSYTPADVIPGLSGSTSFYYTDDTSVRGGYGTNANGSTRPLGSSDLSLFDTELRYRIPTTGLELRAEYVRVDFGSPDNLRANNDTDPENNVGSNMNGHSFEAAYHLDLRPGHIQKWELVPFYRYSEIELQTSGVGGTDANTPTGSGSRRYHTFGAALFPTPKVVIKADYQFYLDDNDQEANGKSILGAVGFFF